MNTAVATTPAAPHMTPQAFLDELAPLALASAKATGIPAGFVLAEGALESGWGNSALARLGCNLFGVKADPAWHGATLTMETGEVVKGARVAVDALWRRYSSWADCVDDHAQFFLRNPRYAAALKVCSGPAAGVSAAFAHAVAQAGYATDPEYAARIVAVIDSYDLTRYDLQLVPGTSAA